MNTFKIGDRAKATRIEQTPRHVIECDLDVDIVSGPWMREDGEIYFLTSSGMVPVAALTPADAAASAWAKKQDAAK